MIQNENQSSEMMLKTFCVSTLFTKILKFISTLFTNISGNFVLQNENQSFKMMLRFMSWPAGLDFITKSRSWWLIIIFQSSKKCSNVFNLFKKQVACTKKVISWNGYPRNVRNKIIKRLENRTNTKNNDTLEKQNVATIFCRIPYTEIQGETLIKSLVKKPKRHLQSFL